MKRSIVLISLAVFAAIISACSPSAATPTVESPPTLIPATIGSDQTTPSELNGTSWTLTSLNGAAPVQGTVVTLTFTDSQVGGTACNSYGGNYTASAGTLTVQNLSNTLMACETPAGAMDQESTYLNALGQATTYQINGGSLTIGTASNSSMLMFTAMSAGEIATPEATP